MDKFHRRHLRHLRTIDFSIVLRRAIQIHDFWDGHYLAPNASQLRNSAQALITPEDSLALLEPTVPLPVA